MIRHIVAIEKHTGIAYRGHLPWDLPADRKYYRDMVKTFGGIVLMGSATFGHPLPGCDIYVASRDNDFKAPGATVIHDINAFLNSHEDVWVAGGAEIFGQTLTRAGELYITEIDAEYTCDRFYPDFTDAFELFEHGALHHQNGLDFRYNVYRPRP